MRKTKTKVLGISTQILLLCACGGNETTVDVPRERKWSAPAEVGWSAPCSMAIGAGDDFLIPDSPHPRLAADAKGRALLVWQQCAEVPSNNNIGASFFDGQLWQSQTLIRALQPRPSAPRVAMSADGFGVAVWNVQPFGFDSNEYATFSAGSWSAALPFDGDFYPPLVAWASGQEMLAVWPRFASVKGARFRPGSGWTAPQAVSAQLFDIAGIGSDTHGNVFVSWGSGTQDDVWVARSTPVGWDAPEHVHSPTTFGGGGTADLAVNASGQVVVSWWQWTGDRSVSRESVEIARRENGTWGTPIAVATPPSGFHIPIDVRVALSARGDVFVVGLTSASVLWANRVAADGSMGTPVTLGSANRNGFRVVADSEGGAVVAWTHVDAQFQQTHTLKTARYDPSGGWLASEVVRSTASTRGSVDLAAGGAGDVFMAWVEDALDNTQQIWFRRFGSD